jgi:hypothetical protein
MVIYSQQKQSIETSKQTIRRIRQSELVGGTVAFHNSVQNRFMKCLAALPPCWVKPCAITVVPFKGLHN